MSLKTLVPLPIRRLIAPYWRRLESPEKRRNRHLEAVADGFNQHAANYDEIAAGLSDIAPQLVFGAARELVNSTMSILDGGCGTGLCGELFRPYVRRLDGVDVSPQMVEMARKRGIYDSLEVSDLLGYLSKRRSSYDLIASAGVLQFFSDVEALFAAAQRALTEGGHFAFTVDKIDSDGLRHQVSPRNSAMYVHSPGYIRQAAAAAQFAVTRCEDVVERNDMQQFKPVPSVLFVLKKR